MTSIKLPELGEMSHMLLGPDHIVFVSLQQDVCPPNPLEDCDGMGRIFSFSRRHSNFRMPDAVELDVPDKVFLSYFEHGSCEWSVRGSKRYPDERWDLVPTAGVWIPDEFTVQAADLRDLRGDAREEWMRAQAAAACKMYTDWCNGDVYFIGVSVYPVRRAGDRIFDQLEDYRFDEPIVEEQAGGFYDTEGIQELVESNIETARAMLGLPEPAVSDGVQ